MTKRVLKQSGMTILEMVVALGIGAVVILVLATFMTQTFDMKAKIQQFEVVSSLEQKVREAARDRQSLLKLTKAINPKLAACIDNLDPACRSGWQPLNLVYLRGQPLDGAYNPSGERCARDQDCPVRVKTEFQAACLKTPCEAINAIYVKYRVAFKDKSNRVEQRTGTVTFLDTKVGPKLSDSGESCKLDGDSRPTFVRRIVNGKVVTTDCQEVLQSNVTIKGIKPGACNRGMNPEVLVGVMPGGDLVCEPVRFKK